MFDKPKERKSKKCVHIMKRVFELEIKDLPAGVMYIVSHCLMKKCGQLSIRKVEPKEKNHG